MTKTHEQACSEMYASIRYQQAVADYDQRIGHSLYWEAEDDMENAQIAYAEAMWCLPDMIGFASI